MTKSKIRTLEEHQDVCVKFNIKTMEEYNEWFWDKGIYGGYYASPTHQFDVSWRDIAIPRFVSLEEARKICDEHGIITEADYREFYKEHGKEFGLPSRYQNTYGVNTPEFFNRESLMQRSYVTLDEARKICEMFDINKQHDYIDFYNERGKAIGLPGKPMIYGTTWKQFFEKPEIVSLAKAKQICKKFGIESTTQYLKFYRNGGGYEMGLPYSVFQTYCVQWADFFGNPARPRIPIVAHGNVKKLKKIDDVIAKDIKSLIKKHIKLPKDKKDGTRLTVTQLLQKIGVANPTRNQLNEAAAIMRDMGVRTYKSNGIVRRHVNIV